LFIHKGKFKYLKVTKSGVIIRRIPGAMLMLVRKTIDKPETIKTSDALNQKLWFMAASVKKLKEHLVKDTPALSPSIYFIGVMEALLI